MKGRPTFPASKLNTAPKINIPPNPVVRKSVSPPKWMFGGEIGGSHEILESYSDSTNLRRETFVRERPAPAMNDVLESTLINPGRKNAEIHQSEGGSGGDGSSFYNSPRTETNLRSGEQRELRPCFTKRNFQA